MTVPVGMSRERAMAEIAYEKHFGKEYPLYSIYEEFNHDNDAIIADIERRIKENDPAEDKELPEGVVY